MKGSLKKDAQDTDTAESLHLSVAFINCGFAWNPSQIVIFEVEADTKDTS